MNQSENKLEFSKVLLPNKEAVLTQEFHWVLLYCEDDGDFEPTKVNPMLSKVDLPEKTLLDYHLEMLYNNKLYDIVIVTHKDLAKSIMKYPLTKEMSSKFNIKIYVLNETEDSTINAIKLISSDLSKDLIIIHGQNVLSINLADAIAAHKIQSSDFTVILKSNDEVLDKIKKNSSFNQYNLYGLGNKEKEENIFILNHTFNLYTMFNSFEAADSMTFKRKVLEKFPSKGISLRADLNDTGVYITKNLFKNMPSSIQTIDFDLVKLMANNQFKKKLLSFIGKDSEADEDTFALDSFVESETWTEQKAVVIAYINDNPDELAVNCNFINNQINEDDENGSDNDGKKGIDLDSD